MVDITRFIRLGPEYASVSDGYLVFKRFSPETGEELEPERQQVSADELTARAAVLQAELEAINAILVELQ